jgi:hypothetical protein
MLKIYVLLQLKDNIILQLGDAHVNFDHIFHECLDVNFPNCWIGRQGPIAWPPRFPDFTPLAFFFSPFGAM